MIVESYGADQWDENSMSGLSVQHMDTVPTPQRGGLFERLAGGVGGGVGGVGPAWMAALQERGQHSTARQSPRYAFDHHHYPASASRTPSHQATPHREQTPLSYGTAPSSGLAVTPLFQPGTEKISVVRAVATSGVGGIEFVLPKVADTSRYVVVPSVVRVSKEVITEIAGTDLFSEVSTKCKVVFTSRVCPAQSEKVITVSNPRVCPDEVYDIWLVSPDPYSLSHKVALPPDIASPTVMLPHAQPPRVFSPLQELDVNVHPIPQVSPLKAPDIGHHIAPLFERKLRTLSPTRDAIHHKQYAEIATSPIPMQREDAYQSGLYEALPVPLVPLLHPADTQLQPPLIRNDVMVERHPPSRHALDRLCMKKGPFAVEEREAKVITTPMVGATSHKSSAVASLPVTPVASAAPIPEAPLVCTSTVSSTIPRRASFSRTRRRGSRRGSGVSQSEGKSESSAPPPPPPPPAAIQGVLGPRRGSSRSSGRRAFPAIPYVDSELGDEELGEGGGGGVGVVREGVLEQMLAEVPSHMSCREQMEPMVGGAFLHTEYIQQLLFAGMGVLFKVFFRFLGFVFFFLYR